ncbi:FecR family protein [Pseudomonas tohonis]|uniref:FecR family protein n=1 Tax=Pseudomonas tohonis TaxID=2725477 RepID=UPI001F4847CC|nr:FecR family protein [Pseudomonas tohonis]
MTGPDSGTAGQTRLEDEARAWLLRLTSGHATTRDAEAFRLWCAQSEQHSAAFTRARQLWQALAPAAVALRQPAAPAASLPSRRFGRRAFLGGAIAASLAVVLVRPSLPGALSGLGADYSTEVGEQRRVDFAEGLTLELNTRTRINRRPLGGGVAGIELLEGEVEVLARVPIRVVAGAGTLDAAGARFNVRAVGDAICVTCLEGSLAVEVRGRSLLLPPGRQLTYDEGGRSEPIAFDPAMVMAWRQQLLVFDDAPLATVIDEINRYRPGMILLVNQELGRRKVQARFRLDQLAEVAALIRDAYGATVTELPGGVVLVS